MTYDIWLSKGILKQLCFATFCYHFLFFELFMFLVQNSGAMGITEATYWLDDTWCMAAWVTISCYFAPMILAYNFVNVFLVGKSILIIMSYDWNSQLEFWSIMELWITPSIFGIPRLRKITYTKQSSTIRRFLATPWQGSWALCVATLFGPRAEFLVISWTFVWCNNGPRTTLLSNANLCGATDITQTSGAQCSQIQKGNNFIW